MVLAAFPIPIFAPAEMDMLPFDPFRLVTTFVAAGAGTEMVTEFRLTPTEAIPAPENWSTLENVPEELSVVFPKAVSEMEDV